MCHMTYGHIIVANEGLQFSYILEISTKCIYQRYLELKISRNAYISNVLNSKYSENAYISIVLNPKYPLNATRNIP